MSTSMAIKARANGIVAGLAGLLLAGGCDSGDGSNETNLSGSNLTIGVGGDSGTDTGSASEATSLDSSTGEDNGGPVFRCTDVDFIFVVDNSPSMLDEQQFLAMGVPGFVDAMKNSLPGVSTIQVGIVDTDSYPGFGTVEDPLEACDPEGEAACDSCDYQLGALLDKPQSAIDPEVSCGFSTEERYMDGTSDTFANEFGCVAQVGAVGNPIEQQAGALVAAVSEESTRDGGCNQGFIRDNALLVFLVISDEEDSYASPPDPQGGSQGEPEDWYASLVEAKDGKETNVVGLGLLGGSPKFDDCADLSQGVDGAEQSSRLVDFVERFPTNFVGSVCSDGYADFFQEALVRVSQGCASFVP